jgi:hypothetical protein
VRVLDGDDVVAITATEAARTNASERKIKVFTADSAPTRNCQPTAATLQIVCFVPISSDGENGFVAFPCSACDSPWEVAVRRDGILQHPGISRFF